MIKEIDILGIKFTVRFVPVVDKNEAKKGQINYLTCEILIDESMPEELKQQTLMHEIFHAICDLTGNYDIGENENAVQGLATAMYCVLKTNGVTLSLEE